MTSADAALAARTLLALALLVLLLPGLVTDSLADLARVPWLRYPPKPVWALIVLLSIPWGRSHTWCWERTTMTGQTRSP